MIPLVDTPLQTLQLGLLVFGLFASHYTVIAGAAWLWFGVLRSAHYAPRRIQQRPLRAPRPGLEFGLSMSSFAIFSALVVFVFWLSSLGYARIEMTDAPVDWAWVGVSLAILLLWHDTYYYWAHRWMHEPWVFRRVHRLHHRFHNPTPFASYAFHPLEAIVEAAWFLPAAMLMQIDPETMLAYMLILTVLNVISHLGVETYPPWVARWFITSTHHNLHHSRGRGHYMLYFNIWDALMGTNEVDYPALIRQIGARARRSAGRGADAPDGDVPLPAAARPDGAATPAALR